MEKILKQDKRSRRTRAWLLETLLKLIEEKDYSDIKITELTDRADIARQTFYRNYQSMDDILLTKMDEILDEYLQKAIKNLENKNDPFWEFEVNYLILLCQKNISLFKALQKAGLAFQSLERLSKFFTVFHMKAQNLTELDPKQQYLIHYLSGGVFFVLNKWVESNMEAQIELLTDLFKKAARNIVQISEEYIKKGGNQD